jgi:hypothetical protein
MDLFEGGIRGKDEFFVKFRGELGKRRDPMFVYNRF